MKSTDENIVLFHPFVPDCAVEAVQKSLSGRWIGQGPAVDKFEKRFSDRFGNSNTAVAVGAGTDALHLAYILAGLGPGDEAIVPIFTCVATNMPLLYHDVEIKFADIQVNTLNIDPNHVRELISDRTAVIVCTHYGGLPCDMDALTDAAKERGIPIVEDASHAIGATYKGRPIGSISDFTAFSFQAIKHITTGDGGMLTIKNSDLVEKAKRVRWFGIDRAEKHRCTSDIDITEIGYKYQMTDIAATMGMAILDNKFDWIIEYRRKLLNAYCDNLREVAGLRVIGSGFSDREHAAWLCTVMVEQRKELQRKLSENKIESDQVHYRNDKYSIFRRFCGQTPNMNLVEDKYLVLPLHPKMKLDDVHRICNVIRSGW